MSDHQVDQPATAPLAGIRVLDFSRTLAGPHCTWLLSCLGADVVKVEGPGGDYIRAAQGGAVFAGANRNKRSIVLDLHTARAREIAYRMSAKFDVLVENFKPGTIARFDLSYDRVRAVNPAIVYASISGFGQDGPYSDRPGYDVIAQAMSGMMAATGEPDRPPVRVGIAPIDCGTGMYAALAIVAALHRRQRTGGGAHIDACLLETAMAWMAQAYTEFSATGRRPERRGTGNESFVPYQVFEVGDGAVFVGVATDQMYQRFCAAFGLAELGADARLGTIPGRCAHRAEVVAAVAAALCELPAAQVVSRCLAIGVPTTEVMTVDQTMADPHVLARQAILPMTDSTLGDIAVTPFPVKMDGVSRGPGASAPKVGEHTAQILREFELDELP